MIRMTFCTRCPTRCTGRPRQRTSATSACSSGHGHAWLRQMMAPMGLWPPRTRRQGSQYGCEIPCAGRATDMDLKFSVPASANRWGCEILRAGQRMAATTDGIHRPLASICPMVPYTLHYWAEAPYGCDIGILLRPRQRVDETTDGSSGA